MSNTAPINATLMNDGLLREQYSYATIGGGWSNAASGL